MSDVALLLLQISTSTVPAPNAGEALLHPVPQAGCHASANEITVCARASDTYRLAKVGPATEASALPKAEWKLFGDAKMSVHGAQRTMQQGISKPAAMVTIKMPF